MAAAPSLTVAEALDRLLAGVAPLDTETVAIANAHGRVLAAPLIAQHTQPPFDASAMDGYAVRHADLASIPVRLSVIGEAAAGRGYHTAVSPGHAVRIFTGASMPPGTDTVVIQEDTVRDGGTVEIREAGPHGDNVRLTGCDFAKGETLLQPGRRLGVREVTLAAASGHAALTVSRKPRIAVLATGDELVTPGTPLGRDQIVASNSYGICAMAVAAGADAHLLGIARDTRESLTAHIREAADHDVLVTIGGASVGDHDLVQDTLTGLGMTLDFWKIAMRPGKPLMYGTLGPQRVLGMPGNPVSALICARLFLVPLIQRMLGDTSGSLGRETAVLGTPVEANGPREHYMRAELSRDADGRLVATPLPSQDSSLLSPLARAGCLVVRPIRAPAAASGDDAEILRIDF